MPFNSKKYLDLISISSSRSRWEIRHCNVHMFIFQKHIVIIHVITCRRWALAWQLNLIWFNHNIAFINLISNALFVLHDELRDCYFCFFFIHLPGRNLIFQCDFFFQRSSSSIIEHCYIKNSLRKLHLFRFFILDEA